MEDRRSSLLLLLSLVLSLLLLWMPTLVLPLTRFRDAALFSWLVAASAILAVVRNDATMATMGLWIFIVSIGVLLLLLLLVRLVPMLSRDLEVLVVLEVVSRDWSCFSVKHGRFVNAKVVGSVNKCCLLSPSFIPCWSSCRVGWLSCLLCPSLSSR